MRSLRKGGLVRRGPLGVLLGLCIAVSACGTRTVVQPELNPETSYRQLVPEGAARYTLAPGESAAQPVLRRHDPPVYPSVLVHAGATPVTVVAQLIVDSAGRVQRVVVTSDSAREADRPLFESAVRKAAMQWVFSPLLLRHRTNGSNEEAPFVTTAKPFSLWFAFRFEVAGGKPLVRTEKR